MSTELGPLRKRATFHAYYSHCFRSANYALNLLRERAPSRCVRIVSYNEAGLTPSWLAPVRRPCCNRRHRCLAAASAGTFSAGTAGSDGADPPPDAAGVLRYQRDMLGRMMSFLGPATLIPLGEPLMSLVDTVCIGQVRQLKTLCSTERHGPSSIPA